MRAQSPFSVCYSQTSHMKSVSILNSPFSDYPHEVSLHSQFAILRLPTWKQSPFSIRHCQTASARTVSILESMFSDYQHSDSLHSQFTILILLAHRHSNFRKYLSAKSRSLFGAASRLQRTSLSILITATLTPFHSQFSQSLILWGVYASGLPTHWEVDKKKDNAFWSWCCYTWSNMMLMP